jgi:hypothetical protein
VCNINMLNMFASPMLEDFILGNILHSTVALLILGCWRTDVTERGLSRHETFPLQVVLAAQSLQSNLKIFTVLYRRLIYSFVAELLHPYLDGKNLEHVLLLSHLVTSNIEAS